MKILITGVAGFIGHRVALFLAKTENVVVGVDYLNNGHYTPWQKGRLDLCGIYLCDNVKGIDCFHSTSLPNFRLEVLNIEHKKKLYQLFAKEQFDIVIHLAAKAGVRESIRNPYPFIKSNILGFMNVMEACSKNNVRYVFFASSSSVYGKSLKLPLNENDKPECPESFYAVTKAHNELTASYYAKMYNMCCVGLRFFTVYGPWGRPDMSPMIFADAILKDQPLYLFGNGDMMRDFTYIDDVAYAIPKIVEYTISKNSMGKDGSFDIFNIGTGIPTNIGSFVSILEKTMGLYAKRKYCPMQNGDVRHTMADVSKLRTCTGFHCENTPKTGIKSFVKWFYYYYENAIKEVIANKFHLDLESIHLEDNFITSYHADSLDVLDLIIRVEQKIGIKIPDEQICKVFTVRDLLGVLKIQSYSYV